MASDLTARSQRATRRGHTHTPHAALAGSTPASSQAAPPSRARPPSRVRPGQQGRSFQGPTFLLSSGMSSPERSWGRPGVRLPGPRSGRAAGCCGPRLSSAHGPQMGRLRTAPPPTPHPHSQQYLPLPWSPGSSMVSVPCQGPPHKPGVHRAAPSLWGEELPLPGERGPSRRGSALALQSVSSGGPGGALGRARTPAPETLGSQVWRAFVPSSGRLGLGLLSGLLWSEGLWAETHLRTHGQLPSFLSLQENQPLRKKREPLMLSVSVTVCVCLHKLVCV